MKKDYTSQKKDNEELKIKFEEFPGDVKKNKETKKKVILISIIVLIILGLFIFSSWFNEILLYGEDDNYYKTINHFDGDYAVISDDKKESLFKKIGFDSALKRLEQKDGKTYETTYALRKTNSDNLQDSISVYYNDEKVFYITMNLFYLKNEFSISDVVNDCNSIINNFVNINTTRKMISEVQNEGFYYFTDDDTNIKATYMIKEIKDNYVLIVSIGD